MSTYVDYAELTQNLDALIDSYNGSIKDISAPMFHLDHNLDGTAKIMFKDLTDIDGSSFSENQIKNDCICLEFFMTESIPMFAASTKFYYKITADTHVLSFNNIILRIIKQKLQTQLASNFTLNTVEDFKALGELVSNAMRNILYVNPYELIHDYLEIMDGPEGQYNLSGYTNFQGYSKMYPVQKSETHSIFEKIVKMFGTSDIGEIVNKIALDPVHYMKFPSDNMNLNKVRLLCYLDVPTGPVNMMLGFLTLLHYVSKISLT